MDLRQRLLSQNNTGGAASSDDEEGAAVQSMDYAFNAQPFVDVPAKVAITLTGMDYAFNGEPFVSNGSAP